MKVVILAGGLGTRLAEETERRPKPMVEVGGKPLLWHIMKIYSHHGFNEFIVACGYRQEVIKDYFLNFYALDGDLTIDLQNNSVSMHGGSRPPWKVHLIDTGLHTQTGGRLLRLRPLLDSTFMLTYGDGVADVDVGALAAFHKSERRAATVTAVRPRARFGVLDVDGNQVRRFVEKPAAGEGWISGGFFVCEPSVLERIAGPDTLWENEPLRGLADDGELSAYHHHGFWQPVDTLREKQHLESLWSSGEAPWRIW